MNSDIENIVEQIKSNTTNIEAWLLLVKMQPDDQRLKALKHCESFNPNNKIIQNEIQKYKEKSKDDISGRNLSLYYDNAGHYAYVLMGSSDGNFPASKGEVKIIEDALQEKGISAIRSGKSFKPANNGRKYDWYIRVTDGGIKPSQEKISKVFEYLSQHSDSEPSQDTQDYIKQLIKDVEKERQEKDRIQLDLQSLQKDIKTLKTKNETLAQKKEKHVQDIQILEERLQSKNEEYSYYEDELSKDLAKKREEYKKLEDDFEELSEESLQHETSLDNEKTRRKHFEQEFEKTNRRYEELQSFLDNKETSKQTENSLKTFEKLLEVLLPEIIFIKEPSKLLFLDQAVERYDLALKTIKKIVKGEIKPDDTIKGKHTWFEYYFSTGQGEKKGRIYSRKERGGKYKVLIGVKDSQDDDTNMLRNLK
jgi:hypothetical protein